jgi:chaperonin cofactor prefoldin
VKKAPKDKDEAKEQYEERIKRLKKRVKDLEKKDSGKKVGLEHRSKRSPGGKLAWKAW